MKKRLYFLLAAASVCLAAMTGCAGGSDNSQQGTQDTSGQQQVAQDTSSQQTDSQTQQNAQTEQNTGNQQSSTGQISSDDALTAALSDADVKKEDASRVNVQRDTEDGISVWNVEFTTDYGEYDYDIVAADGSVASADWEIYEQQLDQMGGSPVSSEQAKEIAADRISGASASDIQIREERDDGRERFEGELFFNGMKYEFEIDKQTGIITDWSAEAR